MRRLRAREQERISTQPLTVNYLSVYLNHLQESGSPDSGGKIKHLWALGANSSPWTVEESRSWGAACLCSPVACPEELPQENRAAQQKPKLQQKLHLSDYRDHQKGPWKSIRGGWECLWGFLCSFVALLQAQSPATEWGGGVMRAGKPCLLVTGPGKGAPEDWKA